jgi:hypothetical protein
MQDTRDTRCGRQNAENLYIYKYTSTISYFFEQDVESVYPFASASSSEEKYTLLASLSVFAPLQ